MQDKTAWKFPPVVFFLIFKKLFIYISLGNFHKLTDKRHVKCEVEYRYFFILFGLVWVGFFCLCGVVFLLLFLFSLGGFVSRNLS